MKLSWSEAESKAQDRARTRWRSIGGGLFSGKSWKAKKKKSGIDRYHSHIPLQTMVKNG